MRNMERKGAVVERVRDDKTKREGVVRLERRSMTFFARVPDVDAVVDKNRLLFESKDGHEVVAWLRKELAKTQGSDMLKWLPVIEVKLESEWRSSRRGSSDEQEREIEMSLAIDRFWIALTKNRQQWLQLKWHQVDADSSTAVAEHERVSLAKNFQDGPEHTRVRGLVRSPFVFPSISGDHSYLEYSAELWVGLNQVLTTIERERETVRALLGSKRGLAQLVEVGAGRMQLSAASAAVKQLGAGDTKKRKR